ncbi:hypothetical protein HMI54_008294 [Coelomomyces lativittatus]|nr:hypothetical protein HMI54_008294 [Coelomomyces lativittatus]KAJ1505414.1 hypothetical protein HMI56_001145 [Coelomomyces lativittatus]
MKLFTFLIPFLFSGLYFQFIHAELIDEQYRTGSEVNGKNRPKRGLPMLVGSVALATFLASAVIVREHNRGLTPIPIIAKNQGPIEAPKHGPKPEEGTFKKSSR